MATKLSTAKSKQWAGPFEALNNVMIQMHKNWAPLVLFVGAYTLITAISLLIQGKSDYTDKSFVPYSDAVMIVFAIPVTVYALAVARRKTISVDEFMNINLRKLLFILATSVLLVLIWAVSLVLLIFPLVWTLAWFLLAVYIVVDKNLTPIEALKYSKKLTENHKKKAWGVIGVTLLVGLVSSILARTPYIGVAAVAYGAVLTSAIAAELYVWLSAQKHAKPTPK